jgi:N-acetylglucosamine kinase-like BadF-type ATPase
MGHAKPICVAGVDGGGTSTRVLLLDSVRTVLGEGLAGKGNPFDADASTIAKNLLQALGDALRTAQLSMNALGGCFLGYAGAGSPAGRNKILQAMQSLPTTLQAHMKLDTDLAIAHAGGLAGEPGIIVIAGTGSSTYGRNARGESARAGGHGSFLDDRGSATDVGRRAAQAVLAEVDGAGPPTSLTMSLLDHLKLSHASELATRLGATGEARERTAGIARLVVEAASLHDEVALGVLEAAATSLAPTVVAVANRLGLTNPTIVLSGGLVENCPLYRTLLCGAIQRLLPKAAVHEARSSPVYGAALLALQSFGDSLIARS